MIPYEPPQFEKEDFNCPHCNAHSQQYWHGMDWIGGSTTGAKSLQWDLKVAFCNRCHEYSLWHFGQMIYPADAGVSPPNSDLSKEIQDDYLEAKSIMNKSPRGASALLRLCIQKLCKQLGEKGEKIDDDIASLVKKGLSAKIQQSLDIVRVIGNNAIHPGQLDLKDDRITALKLFELINLIAETVITQPKEIDKLYQSLPDSSKEHIDKSDKRSQKINDEH